MATGPTGKSQSADPAGSSRKACRQRAPERQPTLGRILQTTDPTPTGRIPTGIACFGGRSREKQSAPALKAELAGPGHAGADYAGEEGSGGGISRIGDYVPDFAGDPDKSGDLDDPGDDQSGDRHSGDGAAGKDPSDEGAPSEGDPDDDKPFGDDPSDLASDPGGETLYARHVDGTLRLVRPDGSLFQGPSGKIPPEMIPSDRIPSDRIPSDENSQASAGQYTRREMAERLSPGGQEVPSEKALEDDETWLRFVGYSENEIRDWFGEDGPDFSPTPIDRSRAGTWGIDIETAISLRLLKEGAYDRKARRRLIGQEWDPDNPSWPVRIYEALYSNFRLSDYHRHEVHKKIRDCGPYPIPSAWGHVLCVARMQGWSQTNLKDRFEEYEHKRSLYDSDSDLPGKSRRSG